MDGFDIGEKVGALEDLVGVEAPDVGGLGQGPADLQGEKSHAPELARGSPCLALRMDGLTSPGPAPGSVMMVREPAGARGS